MPHDPKDTKDAKDFEKGMNSGGGNPLDFAAKAIKKVFGPKDADGDNDGGACPHCGQPMPSGSPSPNPINYPQGSSF